MATYAAAVRLTELHEPSADEEAEMAAWRVASQRSPDDAGRAPHLLIRCVDGSRVLRGFEHAAVREGTLCGLAESDIERVRHLFRPDSARACPRCVAVDSDLDPDGPED